MTLPREIATSLMQRALELAHRGQGSVEPNPAVGAMVVDDSGKCLGEGWHQAYGGPHAEIHALAAAGSAAQGATLLVTLEPCCHFGKTPPCTRAVIAAGIRRVIVATRDPAPHVNGGGITELREAGIQVDVGLLEPQARRLIAPFVQLTVHRRPWFHAKWAMSLDGKIATRTGNSRWISNESSRAVVHQLRGRMDGILVGIGTALADDPLLTARPSGRRIATRIVVDSCARLPLKSQLVLSVAQAPVLLLTTAHSPQESRERLQAAGVEVLVMNTDSSRHPSPRLVAEELGRRRMTNVLVEGGSQVLGAFFDHQLIDEVHAFVSPKLVGGVSAISPLAGLGNELIPQEASLIESNIELLDGDIYLNGVVRK